MNTALVNIVSKVTDPPGLIAGSKLSAEPVLSGVPGFGPHLQLLTVDEVAAIVRATPGAIYSQRYRGEEPGSLGIRVGRRILFRAADIDRFIEEQVSAQRPWDATG